MQSCQSGFEKIFSASESNDYWADNESVVRRANFLYARCLAKVGNADKSVIVLESFLLAPAKYRPEIRQSLNHPDFGRIKTTKIYQKYQAQALKAVKR